MKLKKYLHSLPAAVCAAIVILSTSSCNNDDNNVNEEFEIISSGDSGGGQMTETVDFPTAIVGNFGEANNELESCFTNIVDIQDAKIIIIESGSIQNNEDALSNAYNNGALIAVFNPDGSVLEDWSDRNNVFYAGPDQNDECAIYGFNRRGTYYFLHGSKIIDDEDVPLFHFCSWVNTVSGKILKSVNLRSNNIKQRFLPQSITHTFKISLSDTQIADGHWGDADQLSLSTTANVTYDIYPVHVFDGNAKGDYYAIEAQMVLHNAPLNNGNWVRRRGNDLTEISGFYLNRCDVSASLLRKSNGSIIESSDHGFPEGATPCPTSSPDATTYNSGFEWSFDCTVSGGIPDDKDNHKITSYNNWKWNSSSNNSLKGVEIRNNDNSARVDYSLFVNDLPGVTDNLAVTPVPDAATGDLTFKYSWIWHVSDIDESSNDRLYMKVGLSPVYIAYQWATGGNMTIGEFENAVPENQSTFKFPLTPPNRVATCSAQFRNTSEKSYYISDIRLWRDKSTDAEPDFIIPQTICTSSATGGSGVNAVMLILPTGNYIIQGTRYSMENDERIDEKTITNTSPISLSLAENATIDFNSDIFTVK